MKMPIHDKIKRLRQEKDWTQSELGEKVNIHQKQISSYERGVNIPSTEILIKLAEVFDVTLDYLAFDNTRASSSGGGNIQDRELLRRFEAVDALSEKDRSLAKEMLDLLVLKSRFQQLASVGPL
jgi:transcriptional regulator with XRE-family HTH domain